jgi:hypothetical protein
MSIGAGIALIVIGAILRFAVYVTLSWVDLHLIGDILMAAGVLVVILGIVLLVRKRRSVVTTRQSVDPQTGQRFDSVDRKDDVE